MTVTALVLLALVAVLGLLLTVVGERRRPIWGAGVLALLVDRRSEQAWEAIAEVSAGRTQAQAAVALGITRQAVGQRLAAGQWELERELRPTAARLLSRAAGEGPA